MLLNAFIMAQNTEERGEVQFLTLEDRRENFCRHEGDRHYLKEARKEGMLSLDNVQMVFGKNWKHVLNLPLLLIFHGHLHDLFCC